MTLYVGECRRCGAQHMSFDVYGVSTMEEDYEFRVPPHHTRHRRSIELACRCHQCSCTTVFILRAEAAGSHHLPKSRFERNENPITFGYRETNAFPTKQARPIPSDTPNPAADFYKQAATAFAHGLYDAAGAMFRKCLESTTRTQSILCLIPETDRETYLKSWLKARIARLKEIHAIPPALADLVDVIKDEGDSAVHGDSLYDKESAEALHGFTETFLEQIFSIPAQIERVRSKKQKA